MDIGEYTVVKKIFEKNNSRIWKCLSMNFKLVAIRYF